MARGVLFSFNEMLISVFAMTRSTRTDFFYLMYLVLATSCTQRSGGLDTEHGRKGRRRWTDEKEKNARTQSAVGTKELLSWTMLCSGRDHWLDLTGRHKALKGWHK
jgi:hypothetical protein